MKAIEETERVDEAETLVKAGRGAVYAALVDADAVASWLAPEGMRGEIEAFEPRPGGAFRLVLHYLDRRGAKGKTSDNSDRVIGRFVELVPGSRVVQTVDFNSDDPAFHGTMTMNWVLSAEGDATRVALACRNVPPGISADHAIGLRSTLANLAAFVEGKAGAGDG